MMLNGKTTAEIYNDYLKIDLVEYPQFKENTKHDGYTIVRMQYKGEEYCQRRWENVVYKYTKWLVIKDGVVVRNFNRLKDAKLYIGIKSTKPKRIIRCKKSYDFDQELKIAGMKDEANCAVRAFANIAHIPYEEAREWCSLFGWNSSGMMSSRFRKMLTEAGFTYENLTHEVREKAKTIKTFERECFPGKWLLVTDSHFASSINGVVTDWSAERNLRIKHAYKIT